MLPAQHAMAMTCPTHDCRVEQMHGRGNPLKQDAILGDSMSPWSDVLTACTIRQGLCKNCKLNSRRMFIIAWMILMHQKHSMGECRLSETAADMPIAMMTGPWQASPQVIKGGRCNHDWCAFQTMGCREGDNFFSYRLHADTDQAEDIGGSGRNDLCNCSVL